MAWSDALTAIDVLGALADNNQPSGCVLRAGAGPVRDAWSAALTARLAPRPTMKLPTNTSEERLLGGIDLSETLASGKLKRAEGLLDEATRTGAVLLVPMAETLPRLIVHQLARRLDGPKPPILVLLDESEVEEDAERVSAALLDRVALHLDLSKLSWRVTAQTHAQLGEVRPDPVTVDDPLTALALAAAQIGLSSLRPPSQALSVARTLNDDVGAAIRLSLLGRALVIPQAQPDEEPAPPPPEPPQSADNDNDPEQEQEQEPGDQNQDDSTTEDLAPPDDLVLDAVLADLPAGLLAQLTAQAQQTRSKGEAGRAGAVKQSKQRGRPIGSRPGDLRAGERLHIPDTLRSAIPFQRLRTRPEGKRVAIRKSDFRLRRFKEKRETLTLFVVDASGSTALNRLAEAKGAIELLLAESYARRDSVGLIAFRGESAELLLPPTRALTRAKRTLAGLPGGGGTPLAAGLRLAATTAHGAERKGQSVTVALITDGSANVALDGTPGRPQAADDAMTQASVLAASVRAKVLVIDVARRPARSARKLAEQMNAVYLPLPRADAAALSDSVKALIK